jgi:hypothetical protein
VPVYCLNFLDNKIHEFATASACLAAVLLMVASMNISPVCRRAFVFGALIIPFLLPRAHAGLLTPAYESQLEAWLGQGNLTFTNIYTKAFGDDGYDFHSAVDGKGPTFTLMSISGITTSPTPGIGGPGVVIGGYNPQSWNSLGGYLFTTTDAERNAFIYNLSTTTIQRQNLQSQGWSLTDSGSIQTWSSPYNYGPVFGGGHDLLVNPSLNSGYAGNFSYGGTSFIGDIVDGAAGDYWSFFNVDALEVYSVPAGLNAVPGGSNSVTDIASSFVLIALSFPGLIALRRRFSRA